MERYVHLTPEQNNKDNKGLFAASKQALIVLVVLFCITLCLRGVEHCQHTGYTLRYP